MKNLTNILFKTLLVALFALQCQGAFAETGTITAFDAAGAQIGEYAAGSEDAAILATADKIVLKGDWTSEQLLAAIKNKSKNVKYVDMGGVTISAAVSLSSKTAWFRSMALIETIILPESGFTVSGSSTSKTSTGLSYLFGGCKALKKVDNFDQIKNATTTAISLDNTFLNCNSLQEIKMPESLKVFSLNSTFYNCTSLESIDLSKIISGSSCELVSAFLGCSALKSVVFPTAGIKASTATGMCDKIFQNCSKLVSIVNFDKVTSTANLGVPAAFSGCKSLTEVALGFIPTAADFSAVKSKNFVLVLPKGTTTVPTWAKGNVCVKTGEGTADFIGEKFVMVKGDGIGYNSTFNINLNGKPAEYTINGVHSGWNSLVCPFAPEAVTVGGAQGEFITSEKDLADRTAAVMVGNFVNTTNSGAKHVATFTYPAQADLAANRPYIFEAKGGDVVTFTCTGSSNVVPNSQTLLTTSTASNASKKRAASTGAALCGFMGEGTAQEGVSYLNAAGTGFSATADASEVFVTEDVDSEIAAWGAIYASLEGVATADVTVSSVAGAILVNSDEAVKTTVYGVNGAVVYEGTENTIPVAHGYYLVVAGGKAYKVVVK